MAGIPLPQIQGRPSVARPSRQEGEAVPLWSDAGLQPVAGGVGPTVRAAAKEAPRADPTLACMWLVRTEKPKKNERLWGYCGKKMHGRTLDDFPVCGEHRLMRNVAKGEKRNW